MHNLFAAYKEETSNEEIKSIGAAGIYNCGVHTIVNTELFIYETEWQGTTYTNCDIVLTADNGGVLVDSLRTAPKSNQTDATTDMLTYMHNIAVVTGKLEALAGLQATFATLPVVKYTDRYKKEHKAKSIKIFANAKFKCMTYSEVSGNANGIFTSQRLTLNQCFRFLDGASLSEIKDNKDEVGGSLAYWTDDELKCAAKAQVQYNAKREDADTAVLEVVVEHIKQAKPFTKEQREAIQSHWDVDYAKSVLAGATTKSADTAEVEDDSDDEDEVPFQ